MALSRFFLGCGCCTVYCTSAYMPANGADGIPRGVSFSGNTVTFVNNPWSELEGFSIPIDGYPTGVKAPDLSATASSTNHHGTPNLYGITWQLAYDDGAVYGHAFDTSFVGTPLDCATTDNPLEITFLGTQEPPSCVRENTWPGTVYTKSTSYPPSESEPGDDWEWDYTPGVQSGFLYDKVLYKTVKAVVTPPGLSPTLGDMPRTYDDLGDYTLEDVTVAITYRDAIGHLPTSVLSPGPSDFNSVSGQGITVDPYLRPNLHNCSGGTHRADIEVGRTVTEYFSWTNRGKFVNGVVGHSITPVAQFDATDVTHKRVSVLTGDWAYSGKMLPHGVHTSSLPMNINDGYPAALYFQNTGGTVTSAVFFDAEWSGPLTSYQCTSATDTILATFAIWQFGPKTDGQIDTISPPFPYTIASSSGTHITANHKYAQFYGTRSATASFSSSNGTAPAFSGRTNAIAVNQVLQTASINTIDLYASEEVPSGTWQAAADFTSPMDSLGSSTETVSNLGLDTSTCLDLISASVLPKTTLEVEGPSGAAEFIREEI